MITSRGLATAVVASTLAIAGVIYGVEEFALLGVTVGVVFVSGLATLWVRVRRCKRTLVFEVRVPLAEVVAGQTAATDLRVRNLGRHSTGPFTVEDPLPHWRLSYPGLGGRAQFDARGSSSRRAVYGSESDAWSDRHDGVLLRLAHSVFKERSVLGDPINLRGLRRDGETMVRIPVPTDSRGLLSLHPVGAWCLDPFRMFARKVGSTPVAHVLVCPSPTSPANGRERPSSGGGGTRTPESSENIASEGMQAGYEFRALRPYVAGDRLTRLHWPAFARSHDLVVRDFVDPISGCVSLLVDLRPSSHRHGSIDEVVARAAGLGLRALDEGQVVELCTSSGDRVEIPPGPDARRVLLRSLAVLGPSAAPMSSALRWSGTAASPVWAATNTSLADVVLVTTDAGAGSALPGGLAATAATVIVQ